jgi:hypothetical protein
VAKLSKRTGHRKGRRSRPLGEMWVQQLPAPWKFLKPGGVNHELYPIIVPHPHFPITLRCRPSITSLGDISRIAAQRQLPSPQEPRVGTAAYLNGLGEAVGELRRYGAPPRSGHSSCRSAPRR